MMSVTQAIPETWILAPVGDVCSQPQYGYTTKASNTGDLRLLRTSDITSGRIDWATIPYCSENPEDLEKYLLKDGDILVSRAGTVGVSYLVTKPLKAVFASYLIRFKPYIDRQFLGYFLQSPDYWIAIADEKLGIAVPNVNATKLKSIVVPVPPEREQRRIVNKIGGLFSEIDKGIENLKAARAKLDIYRQSVLKHAFEGKLTVKWREENKDKLETSERLLDRIKQERDKRYEQQLGEWKVAVKTWEDSTKSAKKPTKPKKLTEIAPIKGDPREELPAIPASWEWLNVIHVGQVETGTTPSTKIPENYGGKLPFFKPTDLDQGAHVRTAQNHLSPLGEESARVISAGSTLVTCIGATIGKTGFAATRCATNQQINSITPCTGFDPQYVYLQMVAPFLNDRIKTDASATTLPILNKSRFGELPFVFCSLPEQHELVRLVEERFIEAERSEKEINTTLKQAKMLRQAILKKAFSGNLVEQDSNDEPASVLLDRIRAERKKGAKNNYSPKTKKGKTTA